MRNLGPLAFLTLPSIVNPPNSGSCILIVFWRIYCEHYYYHGIWVKKAFGTQSVTIQNNNYKEIWMVLLLNNTISLCYSLFTWFFSSFPFLYQSSHIDSQISSTTTHSPSKALWYMYLKTQEVCVLSPGYILSHRKHLNTPITSTPTACEKCERSYENSRHSDCSIKGIFYSLRREIKANSPVEMTSGPSLRWWAGIGWKQTEYYLQTSKENHRAVWSHRKPEFNHLRESRIWDPQSLPVHCPLSIMRRGRLETLQMCEAQQHFSRLLMCLLQTT